MDDDLLYGDLYGDDSAAQAAHQPETAVDPRRRPTAAVAPQTPHYQQRPPPQQYQSIQSFQSEPQPAQSQASARPIASFHDATEFRTLQAPPPPAGSGYEDGKMFIGGLSWETTEENLEAYFGQFGTVTQVNVMRDSSNGRSRGFAFLTFAVPTSVNAVLAQQHFLDGKQIDPKRAVPPPNKKAQFEEPRTDKLFVRSVAAEVTAEAFKAYFIKFGSYTAATLMMDRDTGVNRGYGFVDFESADSVDAVLDSAPHYIDGHLVDCKKSHPKPRRDGQAGPPLGPGMGEIAPTQAPQPVVPAAPPAASGQMTGVFNAQTVADYFKRLTGADPSKLASFEPQKMFSEISSSNQRVHQQPVASYAAPQAAAANQQRFQRIATFQSDEPPPMRKAVQEHAGFVDGPPEPPANAPRGPRGGGPGPYRTQRGGGAYQPY